MPLSAKQTEYLAIAWSCFESEPKIDYDRFHKLAGLASPASARELLRVTKKKLYSETPALAGGGGGATTMTAATKEGGGDKVMSGRVRKKASAPGTPSKGPKKGKGKAVERLQPRATPPSDDGSEGDGGAGRVKSEPAVDMEDDLAFT